MVTDIFINPIQVPGGTSSTWNDVSTIVQTNSASWAAGGAFASGGSGGSIINVINNTSTTVSTNSGSWASSTTTVASNSAVWDDVVNKMPKNTSIDVTRVGFLSDYLQVDIKADFEGPAITNYNKSYVIRELNGALVGLRPGTDGVTQGLYYFYCPTTEVTDSAVYVTDIQYNPPFLLAGEKPQRILGSSSLYGFCLRTTSRTLWVTINGTMDGRVHTVQDISSIAGSNDSVTLCKEKNVFIVTPYNVHHTAQVTSSVVTDKDVEFKFYDATSLAHKHTFNFGSFSLGSNSIFDFGTYNGNSISDVFFDHSSNASLHYFVQGSDIYVSRHSEFVAMSYGTAGTPFGGSVAFNSVVKYNTSTNTASYYYPRNGSGKFQFDPTNRDIPPFFVLGYGGSGRRDTRGQMHFTNFNNAEVFETSKGGESNNTIFFVNRHLYQPGKSFRDLVLTPYHQASPATTVTHNAYLSPYDSSYLGKRIQGAVWVGNNKLIAHASSKVYPATVPSDNSALVTLPSPTDTETWASGETGLKIPTDIALPSSSDLQDNSFNFQTVVKASSPSTIKLYKLLGNTFKEYDGNTQSVTNAALKTLPSNYNTQISTELDAHIGTMGISMSDNIKKHIVLYLTGNLFLVTYVVTNKVGQPSRTRVYCALFELAGSNLTMLTATNNLLLDVNNYSGYTFIGQIMDAWMSQNCSIFEKNSTELYIMFKCHGGRCAPTGNTSIGVAKINPSTKTITDVTLTDNIGASWGYWGVSIHPHYGACVTSPGGSYMKSYIKYNDRTATSSVDTRIEQTFNDWLSTATSTSTRYVLSTRSAVGFRLYSSSCPVFLKGAEYVLPTFTWTMTDPDNWIGGIVPASYTNSTIYLYVAIDTGEAKLKYSKTKIADSYGLVQIGTIQTDGLGITSANVSSITRIGKVRVDENGIMDTSAIILTSPAGTKYKISVNDSGNIVTALA